MIELSWLRAYLVMSIVSKIFLGTLAGAAGTATLNSITYLDMAVRGRPPSELSGKMARKLAALAGEDELAKPAEEQSDATKNRVSGLGALLGYVDGFGAGAIFGALRPAMRGMPWFVAGIGLGALTMAMSEGAATALGQTDPSEWSASDWAADIVPRCVYGWVRCIAFDAMTREPR
ncbi:MAG: hypothetical protein ACHQY2_08015 [Candidatus Eremiobacterales bacterium]